MPRKSFPRVELGQIQGIDTAADTDPVELLAAPSVATHKNVVRSVIVWNSSAVPTAVDLLTDATVIATIPAPAGAGATHYFGEQGIECDPGEALNFATRDVADTVEVTVAGVLAI